jgi:large subunit ribosomal protein L4
MAARPPRTPVEKKAPKAAEHFALPVLDIAGKEVSTMTLPHEVFDQPGNKALLSQYVHVYLTNQRQGTVSAKTRSEVAGTTKKVYRQKGTGRARHGAKKAALFKGGGVTFGPRPKIYSLTITKKQRRKALFYTLTLAHQANNIIALSDKAITSPKTAPMSAFLKGQKLAKGTLFVIPKMEKSHIVMATRNIPGVSLTDVQL